MAERRGWPAAVSLQGRQIVAVDVVASILNNREPRDMELSTTPGHQPLFFTIVFGKRDFVLPQKLLGHAMNLIHVYDVKQLHIASLSEVERLRRARNVHPDPWYHGGRNHIYGFLSYPPAMAGKDFCMSVAEEMNNVNP